MKSAIYEGHVWHARKAPRPHRFRYGLYLLYLDLAELDQVFAGRLLWSHERLNVMSFRRRDYLDGERGDRTLDEAVRTRVEDELGFRPSGPIRLLTQIRSLGFGFNPVSFYYCFTPSSTSAEGEGSLEAVVAEITNTPWGERHAYVLDARGARSNELSWTFDKVFHVSPFFDMDHEYRWRFNVPGERLSVHMQNHAPLPGEEGDSLQFEAGLELAREPITSRSLARALVRHPLMSLKVVGAIYWQALRLWWKRTPFFTHPSKRPEPVR